jgi:hypothetical protein
MTMPDDPNFTPPTPGEVIQRLSEQFATVARGAGVDEGAAYQLARLVVQIAHEAAATQIAVVDQTPSLRRAMPRLQEAEPDIRHYHGT